MNPSLRPQRGGVHLYHNSVDLIGQAVARRLRLAHKFPYLIKRARDPAIRIHLEPRRAQGFQGLPLRSTRHAPIHQQKIGVEIELALRRDLGLQHAYGARRRIARISEWSEPLLLALLIHRQKRLRRHQHFPAHFKRSRHPRPPQLLGRHRQRNRADRTQVGRNILAHGSIASGNSAHKARACGRSGVDCRAPAITRLIVQGHRKPIQLVLALVLDFVRARQLHHAPRPVAQLFFAGCVIQREHRRRVRHLHKALACLAAHSLSRRIRRHQLGMLLLDRLQRIHLGVEFGVADLGRIQHKITMLVMANLFA